MAKRFTNSDHWCTGEDSNLRSSGERQIYSLLPLTTRPPVQKRRTQVQPSFLSGRAARSRPQGSTLLWPGQRRKSELARAYFRTKFTARRKNSLWSAFLVILLRCYRGCATAPFSGKLFLELAKGFEPPTL